MPDAEPFKPEENNKQATDLQVSDEQVAAMMARSGDTEEHIREMLNLSAKGPEAVAQEKLAGKFTDDAQLNTGIENITTKLNVPKEKADELIKALGPEGAYKHWQTELSKNGSSDKDASSESSDKDALSGDESNDDGDAGESNTDTGKIDIEKFSNEFAEAGELSEASYKELSDKGIPKDMVDAYIEGLQAQGMLYNQAVTKLAGGEEQYASIIDWAGNNLTQPEKDRFNTALDTGDIENVKPLMEALKARYEKAEGSYQRQAVEGSEGSSGSNVVGYESAHQMQQDMRDPRYQAGDPAFHAYVKNRIKFSKVI